MASVRYHDGQEVLPGDILAPGVEVLAQTDRVVVVVDTRAAVEGYDPEQWITHLGSGILVECTNANGKHLLHYADTNDEDLWLLRRA